MVFTFLKHFLKRNYRTKTTKPKIVILWPFTEKVCQILFRKECLDHDEEQTEWGKSGTRDSLWEVVSQAVTVGIDLKDTKKVQLVGLGDRLGMERKRTHKLLS